MKYIYIYIYLVLFHRDKRDHVEEQPTTVQTILLFRMLEYNLLGIYVPQLNRFSHANHVKKRPARAPAMPTNNTWPFYLLLSVPLLEILLAKSDAVLLAVLRALAVRS